MTDKHPDDPDPLTVLTPTVQADERGRERMAVNYAMRYPTADGYVIAPIHPKGGEFFRVARGKATRKTADECLPRTAARLSSGMLRVALCYDQREQVAYQVARTSLLAHATARPVDVTPLDIRTLLHRGWYTRPTDRLDGRLVDVLSADRTDKGGKPMSTEHANARFFTPALYDFKGWALSADCDILVRADIAELFALADPRYAVMVVKHPDYQPGSSTKMDGQVQTAYNRKLWSSLTLWHCAHPAHLVLRPGEFGILNRWPGRDLHAFRWLKDDEIGELPSTWNHLVGIAPPRADASLVHFTLGTPDMEGFGECEYADEWRAIADKEGTLA